MKMPSHLARRDAVAALSLLASLSLLPGCGDPVGPAGPCIDGETQACVCAGGLSGAQICQSEIYLACDCGPSGDGGVDGDGGVMTGTGETVSMMVGAAGAMLELNGAQLMIPAGALSSDTMITITETTMPTPAGYRAFSPLYKFEPEGSVFSLPVRIVLPSSAPAADVSLATLFWSRDAADGGGFERLGGIPSSSSIAGDIEHFSYGFVADGVDYTEAPDRSCVRTRILDNRTADPSGVALFFAMEDCWGRPITDLEQTEVDDGTLEIVEDGIATSSEAQGRLLDRRGLQVFVTLAIDMSSSTTAVISEVIEASQQFVATLQEPSRGLVDKVQVGITLFAGETNPTLWQPHTLDLELVQDQLGALSGYTAPDPGSTNLHGGVMDAISRSEDAQNAFSARNEGGAFTTGYVVLFTDGADTAGLHPIASALGAIDDTADEVLAVGLEGQDYSAAALDAIVGAEHVIDSPDPVTLGRDFAHLAARVAGQVRRTYLLGYCSPKRAGVHSVEIGLSGAMSEVWGAATTFDATGFGPGCTASLFEDACTGMECGGLGCGACDDRASSCASGVCVDHCDNAAMCGDQLLINPLGYSQICPDRETYSLCEGSCQPQGFYLSDPLNCGACGSPCDIACSDGGCVGVAEISAGGGHTCARLDDGTINCWGNSFYGQLGDSMLVDSPTPVAVVGIDNASAVAAGSYHTCALLLDRTVRCWGSDQNGALGTGMWIGNSSTPVEVVELTDVVQIAMGSMSGCARLEDGSVHCWGENEHGLFGNGTLVSSHTPVAVSGITDAVEISNGSIHACARLSDGSVSCWGWNSAGQIGDGTNTDRTSPVAVPGLEDVVQIAAGGRTTCALLSDGTVRCWGHNYRGALGDGTFIDSWTPVAVAGLADVTEISVGTGYGYHVCARKVDGTVHCWGRNNSGQIGMGVVDDSQLAPTQVLGLTDVEQIDIGGSHSCARISDGTVQCWGAYIAGGSWSSPVSVLW